jgi:hypothetical protein
MASSSAKTKTPKKPQLGFHEVTPAAKKLGEKAVAEVSPPSKQVISEELLAVWDADTWLKLPKLRQRFIEGWTLDDVGIRAIEAEGYVNKYNSIIVRASVNPQVVAPSEARGWVKKKMSWICDEIVKRANA